MKAIHFGPRVHGGYAHRNDILLIGIMTVVVLSILAIGCINYTTLFISRSSTRSLEVGIRKVLGAGRGQLIRQYCGEGIVIAVISLAAGVGLAELLFPSFNAMLRLEEQGVRLALNDVDWITAALACVFFVFVIGVLAGSYPALVLSGFRPTDAIRGTTAITGRRRVTSVLITFQYAMAIALVVGTVVIVSQMRYLESQDLGYSTEQVVVVKLRGEHKVEQGERYKMAISRLPGVINTSLVDRTFTTSYNQTRITNADGDHVKVHQYWVDPDFIETLRIQLVEGRFLNRDRPSDRTESVVVNRAFTKAFGWSDSALGKSVLYNNNGVGGHPLVVGVTEDFHYHGLQERIKPVILQYGPKGTSRFVIVRLETVTGGETLDALGETWRTQNSGLPFDYSFLDEDFARHYRTEEMMHSLITSAAVTAILIACVGLVRSGHAGGRASHEGDRHPEGFGCNRRADPLPVVSGFPSARGCGQCAGVAPRLVCDGCVAFAVRV